MDYYNFHSYSYHIITTTEGKGTENEDRRILRVLTHLQSRPKAGPIRSGAFWGEITQTQRVPEKAPPHTLQNSHLQKGLEAAATKERCSVP
jgi:hypothetical protein